MSKDKGGFAFPRNGRVNAVGVRVEEASEGMTLRDYFAAKAMQSIYVGMADAKHMPHTVAMRAYEMADAMLAERSK